MVDSACFGYNDGSGYALWRNKLWFIIAHGTDQGVLTCYSCSFVNQIVLTCCDGHSVTFSCRRIRYGSGWCRLATRARAQERGRASGRQESVKIM
jgi:hypothetical protein